MDSKAIAKTAGDAYIFAYPMLYNYQTLYTQTQDSTFSGYIGEFGRYRHYSRPYTPDDTDIVTPNNDTAYSWAWLDLRREPIILETPELDTDDRYNVFQWVDLFTYIFASPGSRLSGRAAKTYMFAGPNWQGETPDGVDEVFQSESDYVGTLTRTSFDKGDNVAKMWGIQHGYRFTPLSEFTGTAAPPPAPAVDFPTWHPELVDTPAFISYTNFLLGHVKPNEMDAPAMKEFETIGIRPGAPFTPAEQEPEFLAAIQTGIDEAHKRLVERAVKNKDNLHLFGSREYLQTDYLSRAAGAMIGIYGQNEDEAFYFQYQNDSDGTQLNGENDYELLFKEPPPVSQFWSLSMYTLPDHMLVRNSINRYSIGDRTEGLIIESDGSLSITLSSKDPGAGKNWLPTPAEGDFFGVMRMYGPDDSIVDKSWPRPEPRKLS